MSKLKIHLEAYVLQKDIEENPEKYSNANLKKFKSLEDNKLFYMLRIVVSELGYEVTSVRKIADIFKWNDFTFQYKEVDNDILALIVEDKNNEKTTLGEIHFTPSEFRSKESGKTFIDMRGEIREEIYKEHIILIYEFLKNSI